MSIARRLAATAAAAGLALGGSLAAAPSASAADVVRVPALVGGCTITYVNDVVYTSPSPVPAYVLIPPAVNTASTWNWTFDVYGDTVTYALCLA